MNEGSWMRALAIAALAVMLAAVIGIGAYNAGAAHAVADGGGHLHWGHGFGYGFSPFFSLFFFFLFFAIMRRLWWGPSWGGGWGPGRYRYRRYYDDVPPEFEEWHRRAHGEQPPPPKP